MSGPGHGFGAAEFGARIARAQRIMAAHGLDGLVVTTPFDVRYFSGLDMQFWESPTRPWFLVVPAEGEITAVVPEVGAPAFAGRSWIGRLETWPAPRPEDDGVSLLVAAIARLRRRTGRVGMELGREMALRMPVIDFLALRERAGSALVDGSPCLWEIRMVKSEAEIDRIRHVCRIASDAYAAVPGRVSAGMTEREAARELRLELAERGVDATPFLPAVAGPGGVAQIVVGPGDREIREGDVLFLDTGSTYDGYFCDFDRNYAVGRVADAAHRAQEAVWQATEAGIAAVRPGATTDDLYRAMARVLEAHGSPGGNVGRLGHGLGLQLTEPPSHRPGDGTVLAEGMVLTIEPGMEYAPGRMIVHEENVVVRAGGAELLTIRAPRELPVIG